MKVAITTNFRGLRALVIHGEEFNRAKLVSVLERLGLEVTVLDPETLPAEALPDCDLLLFDADEDLVTPCPVEKMPEVPTIALIGNEAPSRLARVVRHRCDSHILKPIRTTGVFTAVVLAANGHQWRQRAEREIEAMRQRFSGRREVMKAVLHLMSVCGVDEETAYEQLRREAMNRRVPIEDVARENQGPDNTNGPLSPQARMPRKA